MTNEDDTGEVIIHHYGPPIQLVLGLQDFYHTETKKVKFIFLYLDDFLVVTAVDEHQGNHTMWLLLGTFGHLGLPTAWDKLELELNLIC